MTQLEEKLLATLAEAKDALAQAKSSAAIEELRVHHTESEAALVKLRSASATETRLQKMGSKTALPQKPATVVKKK